MYGPAKFGLRKYPSLLSGLRNMLSPYTIEMKDGVRLFAITSKVLLPLFEKTKAQIVYIIDNGITELVQHATDCCLAMVEIPNINLDLRICVDFTRLHEGVKRSKG